MQEINLTEIIFFLIGSFFLFSMYRYGIKNNNYWPDLFHHIDKNMRTYYYYYLFIIIIVFLIMDIYGFDIGKEAFFYTFSTIPQTLATLIGLVAVFIVFKLDILNRREDENLRYLMDFYKINFKGLENKYVDSTPYYHLCNLTKIYSHKLLFEKISVILIEINKLEEVFIPHELRDKINELNETVEIIKNLKDTIKEIPSRFSNPLGFGLSAIFISLMMMPFGWMPTPIVLNSQKIFLIGIVLYLTAVSIFGLIILLDNILGIEMNKKSI